ncbi:hypothetical protein BDK51DRAFT_24651 [Blyttiomyces helicus]|uniref:AMP-activated protein kinase glycogen-binding domain-containing protein n=1 Tax=Blyttiomyces helicus TaxID=388810 RepID=A0A4P9W7S7_9FUNG|nr:hypothetical protein BDK51DRAFT_24651 [Blyttiomyces helicus]|eukprot:RKO86206.1 hypothetical protein BDK51DRAFT_24651 [Blyttiomyces helicus]
MPIPVSFSWSHPAQESVIVTGNFDDWSKSLPLEKVGEKWVGVREFDDGQELLYKFVVDGVWR